MAEENKQGEITGGSEAYDPLGSLNVSHFAYGDRSDSLTKWTLDPKEPLDCLEMELRGLKYKDGEWIEFRKPMMVEEGIGRTMLIIEGHINKNNLLGNIDDPTAQRISRDAGLLCNNVYFVMQKEWKLSIIDWMTLMDVISHQVYLFLTRVIMGREQGRLKQNLTVRDAGLSRYLPWHNNTSIPQNGQYDQGGTNYA